MDEHDKRRVGEQIEPGGRLKAPGRLGLLQRFINTWNHNFPTEWDRLGCVSEAHAWLVEKQLIEPASDLSAADAARCRELREAMRALVRANEGEHARAATELVNKVAAKAWFRIRLDHAGTIVLEPHSPGVDGAIATLLGIVHEAQVVGSWPRLKCCPRCDYAFFDRSKNRSAVWCAMSVCGNRTKNSAYQRRRRSQRTARV